MSESTTNSTASSADLDNIPLVRLVNQIRPEIQNIEVIENSEVTSGFVSECHNDDSMGGTLSVQSEDVVDDSKTEDSDNEGGANDEIPIDIPTSSEQKLESWPTLQILPGGVIKPAEKEVSYPMSIYEDDEELAQGELMYACAKCPRRFKMLFSLVKHVKWHEEQRKREQGHDLSKLTSFEKNLICLKRSRNIFERKYKKKKLDTMSRIASCLVHLDRIIGPLDLD